MPFLTTFLVCILFLLCLLSKRLHCLYTLLPFVSILLSPPIPPVLSTQYLHASTLASLPLPPFILHPLPLLYPSLNFTPSHRSWVAPLSHSQYSCHLVPSVSPPSFSLSYLAAGGVLRPACSFWLYCCCVLYFVESRPITQKKAERELLTCVVHGVQTHHQLLPFIFSPPSRGEDFLAGFVV